MPSRLNAVGETKEIGVWFVRKNARISEIPRSGVVVVMALLVAAWTQHRRNGTAACIVGSEKVGARLRRSYSGGRARTTEVSIWRSGILQYARRSSAVFSGPTGTNPWRS